MGGAVESEGTVEICSMSLWGLISAANWADRNAGVVCRELGFQYSGEYIVHISLDRLLNIFLM